MSALIDIRYEAAGKWASVFVSLGMEQKYFSGKHLDCPLCGTGKDRWRWNRQTEFAHCNACGSKSPIDLAIAWLNKPYKEAVQEIRQYLGKAKMEVVKNTDETEKNRERINRIREGLKPINGECAVSRYLANRGLKVLPEKDCYSHPGIAYYQDGVKVGTFPAMVSIFRNMYGKGSTMHITYLTPEGKKADVESPKKVLPVIFPVTGCAIQLFNPAKGVLAVAEGIESALAIHQMDALSAWACGNAHNMASLEVPDSVKELIIYADEDESFTGVAAAYALAKRMKAKGKIVRVMRIFSMEPFADWGGSADFLDYCVLSAHQRYARNVQQSRIG